MDIDKEVDIARAWKDEEYRNSLTLEQLAQLPPNPAVVVELDAEDLENVNGGVKPILRRAKTGGTPIKTDW